MTDRPAPEAIERMTRALVRIQARLEDDLSLPALARRAGLSPYHFHRVFRSVTGETPKEYVLRLRLERAAYRLVVFQGSILDIALDCGFRSHETFTRAFRRRFGLSPREYRARRSAAAGAKISPSGRDPSASRAAGLEERLDGFELSPTRVRELGPFQMAFIRHVGPYEDVPPTVWAALQRFARSRGWPAPELFVGIAHDAPSITPRERLRFDTGILAPEPFPAAGRVGFQTVPAAWYGVTTFVGPQDKLASAYGTAFERLLDRRRFRLVALPCLELYRTTRIGQRLATLNQTDLCLRLEPAGGEPRDLASGDSRG